MKILLVEDSLSDAALLQESLSEIATDGFAFTLAESWETATAQLRKERFDVLLLDLSLPDITGRDTFVRARAEAPHLPIVVLPEAGHFFHGRLNQLKQIVLYAFNGHPV